MKNLTIKNYKNVLPETLPKEEILSANSKKTSINCWRKYKYGKYEVDLPPNVFSPGGTSENMFKLIESGKIKVKNKDVCVVGAGAGIEGCLLMAFGANFITETDIHAASVQTQQKLLQRYFPVKRNYSNLKSDLFTHKYFANKEFDLILFNPPAVSVPVSKNKQVVRNTSVGKSVMFKFIKQIVNKGLLAENGEIIFTISNTSNLQEIIKLTMAYGLKVKIFKKIRYKKPYEKIQTFIFLVSKKSEN